MKIKTFRDVKPGDTVFGFDFNYYYLVDLTAYSASTDESSTTIMLESDGFFDRCIIVSADETCDSNSKPGPDSDVFYSCDLDVLLDHIKDEWDELTRNAKTLQREFNSAAEKYGVSRRISIDK